MLVLEFEAPPFPLLATVGYALWKPGVTHAERVFEAYDLILCTKGALFMEEEGITYEIHAGKLLVLEPGKRHRGYHPTEEETEVYWIHFCHPNHLPPKRIEKQGGQQAPLARTDQDTEPRPALVDIPKFADVELRTLRPLLDEMITLHRSLTPYRSFELQLRFGELLLQLQEGIRHGGPQSRSYELSERVATYLEDRLDLPFDAGVMERDLHFHFDYLARCLKQHTGMSPLQYRHHQQIERAKRLLAHTDEPLKRIGEQCGFPDPNYFARLFKRETSFTPGAYRRRYRVIRMD
ncbi:helix-turn-helix transcriptional regulator [Paenibacillus rubinfantis]|uniref:helix-turn-helix transcriptional regulator n=1 Tax=Paenibacillus rubinfantis TaxID=1720296 RepID=UPI00073F4BC0|nr:AraC family transcriptional regulator [Paenibacillus rubinfantis]